MAIPVWVQYLVLALLAPILLLSGKAAQLLRLPLITGYVLAGIILGPYGLSVLDADSLQSLTAVTLLTTSCHARAWLCNLMLHSCFASQPCTGVSSGGYCR